MNNSMSANFRTALAIIKRKPWALIGIILLGQLLMALASALGVIPLISLPLVWALEVGLSILCLKGVRNQEVSSKDLFAGFSSFKHVAGGMAWKSLWVYIWLIVPVYAFVTLASGMIGTLISNAINASMGNYGAIKNLEATSIQFAILSILLVIALIVCAVFSIIKSIHYSFTPYILMDKPEVHCMDAIKVSKQMTAGIRGGIFWAIVLPSVVVAVCGGILSLFAMIPFIGIIFALIKAVFSAVSTVFLMVFTNLVMASFYNNAAAGVPAPGAIPAAYYNQIPNGYNPYQNQAPNAGYTQPPVNNAAQPNNDGKQAPSTEEVNSGN